MSRSFRHQQYKMLALTMLCYLFFYTGRHNFGWAASGMAEALSIPYATIGWISFSMLMGYAIGQFINGNLADRFNPRLMVTTGAYLSVLANVAISFANSVPLIITLWALNGYFQSMAWAPGGKIITNWWHSRKQGMAFGFYTMAAGLSSVITYLLSIVLLQQDMEWQMLFRLPVLLLFLAATIFLLLVKNKPSDIGHDDLEENNVKSDTENSTLIQRYQAVFKNRGFLTASLAFGLESMARYGLIFWVPVHYLGDNWKDNPGNLWVTFLLPVGMAAGAVSFGVLSDTLFKGNRMASIRFGMLICALVTLMVFIMPSENVFLGGALMLLSGFFVYGPQANFWPLSPEMLGSKLTGTGIGFMNMCGYVLAALGEPFFGYIIDWSGQTKSIFIIIAAICLGSAIIISRVSGKERVLKPGNYQVYSR